MITNLPSQLDHPFEQPIISLTIDVEWAADEVIADIVQLLDERRLPATFFCTHAGIELPGHERALHPNFRRHGDTLRRLRAQQADFPELSDLEIYRAALQLTHAFCPEAMGARTHSLIHDIALMQAYQEAGLQYDSSYYLPLATGLRPFQKEYRQLEFPIYYMDYFDLIEPVAGFELARLQLATPGLKVLDFHPNIVFINARDEMDYLRAKDHYHNADELRKMRVAGRGARTLFIELIDMLATGALPVVTLGQLNHASSQRMK
jgi:hypothetical protein